MSDYAVRVKRELTALQNKFFEFVLVGKIYGIKFEDPFLYRGYIVHHNPNRYEKLNLIVEVLDVDLISKIKELQEYISYQVEQKQAELSRIISG
jgi:hypothetical protein